jgi:MFS family permease
VLLFSIPWGYFADKHGRRLTILILCTSFFFRAVYIQLICAFGRTIPLELAWLSSLYTIFGGGNAVANAMVFTVISDVVNEAGRYVNRSICFVYNGKELFFYYSITEHPGGYELVNRRL